MSEAPEDIAPHRPITLVIGDLHLRSSGGTATAEDLAALVRSRPGAHVVLSGDVFDLALEGDSPLHLRLHAIASVQRCAIDALRDHLAAGGRVTYVAGNHDHEMVRPEAVAWLGAELGPGLEVEPWFVHLGEGPLRVHVEHGHQWDPDNAHADPERPGPDPLGILLTRRFVSQVRDPVWLGDAERTPIDLLARTFIRFGVAAPALILRYFRVALGAVAAAGAAENGAAARPRHPTGLRALHPAPTLGSRRATWRRLYFTRVVVTLGTVTAVALVAAGLVPRPSPTAGAAALLAVLAATFFAPNRYRGGIAARLRVGALATARETGASAVVFSHAHAAADGPIYWNTGSFGLPRRGAPRTFVEIAAAVPILREMPVGGPAPRVGDAALSDGAREDLREERRPAAG